MFKHYLEQLNKKRYFICYTGKFNPFHSGHKYVYDYLCSLPGITKDDVYICTKLEDNQFITAKDKKYIIELYGVPSKNIVNYSGYNIKGLLSAVTNNNLQDNDIIITAFADKDLDDNSKSSMLGVPKDEVRSWKKINNTNDIKYLRPYNYVQKEYENKRDIKEKKGNGYIIVVPTKKHGEAISSSRIRKLFDENKRDEARELMDLKAFNYLKKAKSV